MSNKLLTKKLMNSAIFLVLLIIILFVGIQGSFNPSSQDKPTILISLLSFAATLYAPIAAFIFYDSWKSQTKFNRVTNNIIELQKVLHDYVSSLKSLRQRIISPHLRSKFEKEDDYTNNLKKLFDQKICEIHSVETVRYEACKLLSILRTDTYETSDSLSNNFQELDLIIDEISKEVDHFKNYYMIFINNYYKNESELKDFLKSEDYKELTYKLSAQRELSNTIKTNLKAALTLSADSINPEKTLKINDFIKNIDKVSTEALKNYEINFKN
ncbi:hypothetical protein [Acinetobacter silvestris]|uniref:Uncharacterized protein n=1 Tax=Acinetobacter silvestris TaxID=1977882 RepID=A0A1Y3CIX7_9GAMM|nr:hypothetical protein [Acinetobacter silvestris]OTG66568.1 hypothetical protein B9T28_04790 [Acinetobacter silvestris]